MKKLHNTVLQAVIGQLDMIKSNLEGLLPTEDQRATSASPMRLAA